MKNTEKIELFEKTFGEKPTESVTDKFLMDTLLGIQTGKERKPSVKRYRKATISEIIEHYSKSA